MRSGDSRLTSADAVKAKPEATKQAVAASSHAAPTKAKSQTATKKKPVEVHAKAVGQALAPAAAQGAPR